MATGPRPLECPTCQTRLRVPPSSAGKTVRCPKCQEPFTIPATLPTAVPLPPPAPVPAVQANPFDFPDTDDEEANNEQEPRYFTVVEPRTWTTNRVYRVFVTEDELVCVYAGGAADMAMLGAQFGLVGGLIAGRAMSAAARRRAELDKKELDELRDDHKHNFTLAADGIDGAEVLPPSFWFRLNHSTVPMFGLLMLSTSGGNRRLAVASAEDLNRATELLGELLGKRFKVKVKVRRR